MMPKDISIDYGMIIPPDSGFCLNLKNKLRCVLDPTMPCVYSEEDFNTHRCARCRLAINNMIAHEMEVQSAVDRVNSNLKAQRSDGE